MIAAQGCPIISTGIIKNIEPLSIEQSQEIASQAGVHIEQEIESKH